ncbi:MAG TPA: SRPBCC domain-containing protein [Puia sp.]|nr:SRPBCC domain-containing protein [Puia sp.]
MKKQDFTTTILVDQTPKQAFDAINNVRGWWSGEIEGPTDEPGKEFTYRYKEFHYSKHKVTEFIPDKKIVWLITKSTLNFVKDKNEWIDTKIIFDVSEKEGKTQIRFTHEGLTPQLECFDACSNAWTGYITDSLRKFIASASPEDQSFTTTFVVDKSPQQAFDAINNPRGWWSEDIEGNTDRLQSEFDYHFQEVHRCRIRIVELVPSQKVVWLVLDNYFNFTENKNEWKGTKMIYEITKKGAQTEVRFTHHGLIPEEECYAICNKAWNYYVSTSLYNLIATGKGGPNVAEGNDFEKQREDRPAWQN